MLLPLNVASTLMVLAIVFISCLIVARFRDLYEKLRIPLAAATFAGGLVIYTIGYMPVTAFQNGPGLDARQACSLVDYGSIALRAFFSSCRIFVLENDFQDMNPIVRGDQLYVIAFYFIHMLGLMITVLTILSLFGVRFISRIQLFLARPAETFVFLGYNEHCQQLVKSLRGNEANRCIVVIDSLSKQSDEERAFLKTIRENRCILIDRDPSEVDGLRRMKLPARFFRKKLNIFIMDQDEDANFKAATSLVKSAKKEKRPVGSITLYIQSSSESDGRVLESISRGDGPHVECKIFSVPDLVARQLMESCPIIDVMDVDAETATVRSDFNLFIAGFGPVGVEVFRKCLYNGQFEGGQFNAVITDGAMKNRKGTFNNRYSAVSKNYNVRFLQAEPGSSAFFKIISDRIHELNYIIVALEDDRLSFETAVEIDRLIKRVCPNRKITLAAYVSTPEGYSHYEDNTDSSGIQIFGRAKDLFTEPVIINECMDKMARIINEFFNRIYGNEPLDNWSYLDTFTKESNRSAAMNICAKLRLMGLEMGDRGSPGQVELAEYLTGLRLENLAKQEHLRWNAFHFASGWTTWELSETSGALKAKDSANKRHACLVSWDRLREVTERFQQKPSYEELDYDQVMHMRDILDAAGKAACRTNQKAGEYNVLFNVRKRDTSGT